MSIAFCINRLASSDFLIFPLDWVHFHLLYFNFSWNETQYKTRAWISGSENIARCVCFEWNARHIFKIDVSGKEMFRDDKKGEPSAG